MPRILGAIAFAGILIALPNEVIGFDCNKLAGQPKEDCQKNKNEQMQRFNTCKDKPRSELVDCYCRGWHEKLRPLCVEGVKKRITCLDKEGDEFAKCVCTVTTLPQSYNKCIEHIEKNYKCQGKSGKDLKHCHMFMPSKK